MLDRKTGTLFAGDLVFDRHTPALDGSLTGWRKVLAELTAIDVARVVPGHGAASIPWPGGGADLQRYLDTLDRDTRAAIGRGERLGKAVEHIGGERSRATGSFSRLYNPRNATVAFTELEWQ